MALVTDKFIRSTYNDKIHPWLRTLLSLDRRGIIGVDVLRKYCKLRTIDLRDNQIFSVANLSNQSGLTHLYLQNNNIRRLDGFESLESLEVLYLDYNKLEVVENLQNCPLIRLSVRGQVLEAGQTIAFEPFCMKILGKRLKEINVSKNRLKSVRPLCTLVSLEVLDASENDLGELEEFLTDVSALPNLKDLNVSGTPITDDPAHFKEVVHACKNLKKLGGTNILPQMRVWCENMTRNRKSPKDKSFMKDCFVDSVSSLPTSLRPEMDAKFVSNVYNKINDSLKSLPKVSHAKIPRNRLSF